MIVTLVHKIPGDCDIYLPMNVNQQTAYGEMNLTCTHSSKKGFIHHRVIEITDS